jgi:rare lipoprotein A
MRRRLLVLIALLAATGACGKKPRVMAPPSTVPTMQEGLATWYGRGDGYHGKKTASGERFDRNRLTAAHFNLPFGTRVRVTNRNNGREVVVRINDRLPQQTLRRGRIIDVSHAAARRLGMVRDGVVPVVVEVVSLPGDG